MSVFALLCRCGVILYGDKNFRGSVVEVAADVSDLKALRGECSGSFDDCISSIRVIER